LPSDGGAQISVAGAEHGQFTASQVQIADLFQFKKAVVGLRVRGRSGRGERNATERLSSIVSHYTMRRQVQKREAVLGDIGAESPLRGRGFQ
jgi:hypothetical protein